jgi:uncharacterized protein YndB with AHSA1/START domain
MNTTERTKITVSTVVNVPAAKVWKLWTEPVHVTKWNHASDDWHTTIAENDLQEGGRFMSRMEAKDGSMGFDFGGTNNIIRENEYLSYTIDDGRNVEIIFDQKGASTHIAETFEAENTNPIEMQRMGWQAIMDSFKRYAKSH